MNALPLTRMNRPGLAALPIFFALALSACGPASGIPDPTVKQISEDIVIKKVCLDGVSYYATYITDSIDSVAGRTYWVVGGVVFAPNSAVPVSCEK